MFKQKLAALILGVATAIGFGAFAQDPPLRNFSTPATGNVSGTPTDDNVLVGNGTAWQTKAVADCDDTGGNHLNYDTGTNAFSCGTSGSGGTPGGSTTQVQYNDAGAFAGDADFTYTAATNTIKLGTLATTGILLAGDASTTTSNGAALTVRAGPAGSTSGNGGTLNLSGGVPTDGNGGNVSLSGANAVGTNRTGGSGGVSSGSGTGTAAGGSSTLTGGNGGATGAGGTAIVSAGNGGGTSGNGGAATIRGGTATDGNGGSVNITARDGTGTNRNGGDVVITLGVASGSGTAGTLQIVGGTLTGAQTATFTATNKPGSGTTAPSLWLRIVVSGTTYYVPMWQ